MEIAYVLSLPNSEGVGLEGDAMSGADDGSVLDFPKAVLALPSGKVFSIEKGFESGLGLADRAD